MNVRTRHPISEQAAQVLMEKSPSIAALLLWIRHRDAPVERGVYAYTDGTSIFYGLEFSVLSLPEQVFWVTHEVLHVALCHPTRHTTMRRREGAGFDPTTWHLAEEIIVNEALSSQRGMTAPEHAVFAHAVGLDDSIITDHSVESLYLLLKHTAPPGGWAIEAPDDCDPAPGDPDDPATQQSMRDWHRRLVVAGQGDRPGGIVRNLTHDIPHTTTPWDTLLRSEMTAGLMATTQPTWARPSRRYLSRRDDGAVFEPGSTAVPRPVCAIIVDTSASIDDRLLHRFASEIAAIIDRTGAHAIVITCDAAVTGVTDLGDDPGAITRIAFTGGGGTDFRPGLAKAAELGVEICVYLTDLMGTFPPIPPSFRVIWAVYPPTDATPPFGTLITLDDA